MKDVIPSGVEFIQKSVSSFLPKFNLVQLNDGTTMEFNYLVVATGIYCDWNKIPGLKEAVREEGSGVISIYSYQYSDRAQKAIQNFKGGRALFTLPDTPVKCSGAAQKIMWLAEEQFNIRGLKQSTTIEYYTPGKTMFGVPEYSAILENLRIERGIHGMFEQELIEVNHVAKTATFRSKVDSSTKTVKFDLLHAVPPMAAPDVIRKSPFANSAGYFDADKHSLQSTSFPNVFGIGDSLGTPNSKTAAAIMAQAPVIVHNIQQMKKDLPVNGYYNGYSCCPILVGYKKLLLSEFSYDNKLRKTFGKDAPFPYSLLQQDRPSYLYYVMKVYVFPAVYWFLFLRGHWFGSKTIFKPNVTIRN